MNSIDLGLDLSDVSIICVETLTIARPRLGATEYLLELGHRRIGFVAGDEFSLPTREKARGREDALRAAGLDASRDVAHGDFTVEGGRRTLRSLVHAANGDRPTAVICSNDLMAIGALQEAAALGLGVPDDLSIVGFDGIEAAEWTSPPLTTVEQPIDEIAETAVDALCSLIEQPRRIVPRMIFRPRLRARGSTAPPSSAA